jgi:hypothetical protein
MSIITIAAILSAIGAVIILICLYNQTRLLAGWIYAAVSERDAAIKRMAETLDQLKAASDNTARIIDVINGIAVRTNRLALSAAIEAADAGEAGKGFAEIAEEAHALAVRYATAAKKAECAYTAATLGIKAPSRAEKLAAIEECELWR